MQPTLIDSHVGVALEPARNRQSRSALVNGIAVPPASVRGVTSTRAAVRAARAAGPQLTFPGRDTLWVLAGSVALAAVLEVTQIGLLTAVGGAVQPASCAADTIRKMSWGILLCLGLWLGVVVSGAQPRLLAAIALVAGPVASLSAHALAAAVQGFASSSAPLSPFAFAGFRGVEYLVLVLVLTRRSVQAPGSALYHAATALLVALVFGSVLLGWTAWLESGPPHASALVAWVVNEILFPVGCALIMFRARLMLAQH